MGRPLISGVGGGLFVERIIRSRKTLRGVVYMYHAHNAYFHSEILLPNGRRCEDQDLLKWQHWPSILTNSFTTITAFVLVAHHLSHRRSRDDSRYCLVSYVLNSPGKSLERSQEKQCIGPYIGRRAIA
jgi:hypothetical protein